jgi:hypothetical protein
MKREVAGVAGDLVGGSVMGLNWADCADCFDFG